MNNKKAKHFLITGASSGLGWAVSKKLLKNGSKVILTARSEYSFTELVNKYPNQVIYHLGDVNNEEFIEDLIESLPSNLSGVFINAGGPPAATFEECSLEDWDDAYKLLIRWKIQLVKGILPIFQNNQEGTAIQQLPFFFWLINLAKSWHIKF
ncbi:MAG TPA: SDR family NAD(P)-dependent oxidoreductase [Dysgonamonadaceae bacterium]|nr:SDR family NAD(P)-dependent oxidoreductase [Dysgonamonadaceae bacterium]